MKYCFSNSQLIVLLRLMAVCVLSNDWQLPAAPVQTLSGNLPPTAGSAASTGRLPASRQLNLAVGLPLRNREVLTNLLSELYDPNSPNYHRWLTVDEFTRRFGPSERDYETLNQFLAKNGLVVKARHANRMVVEVSGTVAEIETTFHVHLLTYPHPREARNYFAPDTEPSLDVAVPVLHIGGLDDYELPHPANLVRGPIPSTPGPTPQAGSGPGGQYMGGDFRAAYASGVSLNGSGQYVGLLEFDGYYPSDITSYASLAGLTNLPLQNVLLDGVSGSAGSNNSEVALDIEVALCMAPGLAGLIVYEGGIADSILSRMAADNIAKQLSASWTFSSDALTTQIFQEFAVQGQSYFNASGDSGAYSGAPRSPTDNPYITVVGGTTLSTRGAGLPWLSEKTWSWYNSGTGTAASSGGSSHSWLIPTWQQGINMTTNHGSTTFRNLPDVAMVSDNVFIVADNGIQESVGGDSIATPLWAAFTALANQQATFNAQPTMGFLNPAIYDIGKSSAYATTFHDIQTGNNTNSSSPTLYYAAAGYDLCTGWGTPIGKALINTLAPPLTAKNVIGTGAALTLESCVPTNGSINPSELVVVNFTLQNIGAINTASLVATLQSNANVEPLSGPQTYGILVGGGGAVSRSFAWVPHGTCGQIISPMLQLQDGASNLGTVAFNFMLGTPLQALNQNFDGVTAPALPTGWTGSTTGSGSNWITTSSIRYAGANSIFVGGSLNPGISELVSPAISITTTSAQLSFKNNYVTEISYTNATVAYDGGMLEIQIGSGAFTDILSAGGSFVSAGYTGALDATTGNPLAGRQVWSGTSGGFLDTVVNLPANAAGQTIRLKWRLATDTANGNGSTFWYLDNIVVNDGATCCTPASTADLAVTQTVLPDPALVGGTVAYGITVTNMGPGLALEVMLTDALPANATFVYASPGCVYANGSLSCSIPYLLVGGKTNFTALVIPSAEGAITNRLSVGSTVADPNPLNSTATAITDVNAAPMITQQPSNQVVATGSDVSFTVQAAGTDPLSYQWSYGSTALTNATGATLLLTQTQPSQSGSYVVTVSNPFGSASSAPASLVVLDPPVITVKSVTLSPTNVLLSVPSVAGVNYTLEFKNSLEDPVWTPLPPPVPGTGLSISLLDTNGTSLPSRFYRVNCH